MNNNNRSFFKEFIKWFFIWHIIVFIFKGIVFLIRLFFIVLQKMIYLIVIGIKKLFPKLKEKFYNFKNNYNTKYKFEIKDKWQHVTNFFKVLKNIIKETLSKIELIAKKSIKKKKRFVKEGKIKPILLIKKFRYAILGLFYKYELQFIIISIIVIIIVGIILGLKLFR